MGIVLFISLLFGIVDSDSLHQKLWQAFANSDAPGGVVVWVQADSITHVQSFGLANIDQQIPINADSTIFRVGSISKVITAMAALRQTEIGALNLDAPVNFYLPGPIIKDRFPTHVSLRHLLTHTGGFDDRFVGKSARTREEALSLREAIYTLMPPRIMDSGTIASYSNFGVALAGFMVEHSSGTPFSEYVDTYIFDPLGMHQSSFDPDDELLQNLAQGYFFADGAHQPVPYDYILDSPSGQMVSTATDMARFISSILDVTRLEENNILTTELANEMLQVQFTHHPKLNSGVGYLWNIGEFNGHPFVGHNGGYIGASARLMIFPEHNSGFFVAVNTSSFNFIEQASEILTNFYFQPIPEPTLTSTPPRYTDEIPLDRFKGIWRNTRYTRNDFTKFAVLSGIVGGEMKTSIVSDTLLAMPDHTGAQRRLIRIESDLFQSLDDDYKLAFRIDDGRVTHVFTNGTTALEKVPLVFSTSFQIPLIISLIGFFFFMMLMYPVTFLLNYFREVKPAIPLNQAMMWVQALMVFILLDTFGLILMELPAYEFMIGFGYGVPNALYVVMAFGYLLYLIPMGIIYLNLKSESYFSRIYGVMYALAGLVLAASLNYWNVIGWHF